MEIEQRDISEEGSDSEGSASNPSEDNFDQDEMFEQVYCLEQNKTGKKIQERKAQTLRFIN